MTTETAPPPDQAAPPVAENPYVGPRAFRLGERFFFGRERETRELTDLLTAERVVILHAPSGAGKTSLIQAGLIPALAPDFDVLPVIRVGRPRTPGLPPGVNRYLFSTLVSVEALLPPEQQTPASQLADLSLADYLTKRAAAGADKKPQLLIFDQFEEVLTLDSCDDAAKDEFFGQLADLLRRDRRAAGAAPARWALFALRDEFVAALTPYLQRLPVNLSETYRLDLLGVEAAVAAIRQPAEQKGGVLFAEAAARKLVDNLRRIRFAQPVVLTRAVAPEAPLGPYVEPVHLQVVCYRLWEQLRANNRSEVRESDIDELADVDNALAGYYRDRVQEAAAKTGVGERVIRVWFEQQLITPDGRRAMVQPDAGGEQALDEPAVQELVNAFLVRREERRGLVWLELSHDRLIEPVRQDNARWLVDNLAKWQLRALEWARQGRPDKLLLTGVELGDAQARKMAHPDRVSRLDEEYLEKSWSRATRTDQVKTYLYRRWAYVASTICVVLLGLTVGAVMLARHAISETKRANTEAKAAADATAEAVNSKQKAEQKSVELNQALDRQVILYTKMLTRLSEKASRLATTDNYAEARMAATAWKQLYAALYPTENPLLAGRTDLNNELEPYLRKTDDHPLVAPAQQNLTLDLAHHLGAPLKDAAAPLDTRYVLWKLRKTYYADAIKTAKELAPLKLEGDALKNRQEHFWRLYYGEMAIVENETVAEAMVEFGNALNAQKKDLNSLHKAVQELEKACNTNLSESVVDL